MNADQTARDRFAEELDKNFSVVAPAGVGKTTAIVNRIFHLAKQDNARAEALLPKLVVVTYTNKAAKEMQQRARGKIIDSHLEPSVVSHFNRAFFGTIHSFCLKLLRQYGHHLGLPSQLDLFNEDEKIFFSPKLKIPKDAEILKYVSIFDIFKLASQIHGNSLSEEKFLPPPSLDFKTLFDCPPNNRSKGKVEAGQVLVRSWIERKGFNPIPEFEGGGKEFQSRWRECFAPLREWIAEESLKLASHIANEFRNQRLSRGKLSYQDQIELAAELLQHPTAGKLIREQKFLVILDEAQDTDPNQFRVLLEMTRSSEASGDWLQSENNLPPRAGAFCMVGDPQQSIYGNRADLAFYKKVHQQLIKNGAEELTFHVTFRCDQAVVQMVNQIGGALLNGQNNQANYVELFARDDASQGQTVRVKIPPFDGIKQNEYFLANHEGKHLAHWIAQAGLEGLQARCWSEVAILCPRKRWFEPLAHALRKKNLDVQIQSHRETIADSPFYLWVTALSVIMSQPRNAFEIVGVLREILGLSDASLAEFCRGDSEKFQIENPTEGKDIVAQKLNELHHLRREILHFSLRDAVEQLCIFVHQHLTLIQGFEHETDFSLMARAAESEAKGMTLFDWAEELLGNFENSKPEEDSRKNAIQLITCQKAKGLEWDAVIIPFFARKIYPAPSFYPRIVRQIPGESPDILLSKGDQDEARKEMMELRAAQELQRILYVSLTRPRHTLVIADDAEIFKESASSFSKYLLLPEMSEKVFPQKIPDESKVLPLVQEKPLSDADWISARKTPFIKRILPHSLAKKSSSAANEYPEQRLLTLPQETDRLFATERVSALAYGIWWHQMCENLPWNEFQNWQAHFEKSLAHSPIPDRAQKEWKLFLESELTKLIHENCVIHTEMPILHPLKNHECVEGLIDFASYDAKNKTWLIVDWKTDETENISSLLETYAPQLRAYQEALETISSQNTLAGIYSTSLGIFAKL